MGNYFTIKIVYRNIFVTLDVPKYKNMFLREKKNKSGSISVQIISKERGKYRLLKTIGCTHSAQEVIRLKYIGLQEIERLLKQSELFVLEQGGHEEQLFSHLHDAQIRNVGPEMIFGKLYNYIGFPTLVESLFRHLVIARLTHSITKVKALDYVHQTQGIPLDPESLIRFFDTFDPLWKESIENAMASHVTKLQEAHSVGSTYLIAPLQVVSEGELFSRKKNTRRSIPSVVMGVLLSAGGFPLSCQVLESGTFEEHSLELAVAKTFGSLHSVKPMLIGDSRMLSKNQLNTLASKGYTYIRSVRIKSESVTLKQQILEHPFGENPTLSFDLPHNQRFIVTFSEEQFAKDQIKRTKGIQRIEKQIKAGTLNLSHGNNKGYNRYVQSTDNQQHYIDYAKLNNDAVWDGLQAFITNSSLTNQEVLDSYRSAQGIEEAFGVSASDMVSHHFQLFHKRHMDAHLCISLAACAIYQELERRLKQSGSTLTYSKAIELVRGINQISYTHPHMRKTKSTLLKLSQGQKELYQLVHPE